MAAGTWREETAGRPRGTVRPLSGCGAGLPKVAVHTARGCAEAVRDARQFTAATLTEWGVAGRRGDIMIVVSELLTNALRHSLPSPATTAPGWPVRLGLLQRGHCLLCAVADSSSQVPVLHEPGYLAETGRGLHVIAALCEQWGCTPPGPGGKVVWASFSAAGW
jgi:Histidine kinase-like ATPase domain